jgi:hypothetical protein
MVSSKSPLQEIAGYRARIRLMTPPRTVQEKRLIRMLEFLIRETLMQWAEGGTAAQATPRWRGQGRDPACAPPTGVERPAVESMHFDRDSEEPGLRTGGHALR